MPRRPRIQTDGTHAEAGCYSFDLSPQLLHTTGRRRLRQAGAVWCSLHREPLPSHSSSVPHSNEQRLLFASIHHNPHARKSRSNPTVFYRLILLLTSQTSNCGTSLPTTSKRSPLRPPPPTDTRTLYGGSNEYHLSRIIMVHQKSEGVSLLAPLKQLQASWGYEQVAYPYACYNDEAKKFQVR